jgi:lincosamide nucleotidyltransferase A/C/D/E
MSAIEVLAILDAVEGAGCRAWVAGGWGVDALAGSQTRSHRDLDLVIPAQHEQMALAVLEERGYAIETDWRPVRVELAASVNRWVDVHPVVFAESGDGVQAGLDGVTFHYPASCFVVGRIGDRRVGCLSIAQQVAFHSGYEPRELDYADLRLLHELAKVSEDARGTRPDHPGGPARGAA